MSMWIGSGDMGAQVAALVVQSGLEENEIARTERQTEERVQDAAEQEQVELLRQKADDTEMASFVEGGTEIAAGCMGGQQTARGLATTGAGKIGGGVFKGLADRDEADAAAAEHAASHARRAVDDAIEAGKDARKLVGDAIDFYRGYENAAAQAQNAALRRA
jgi:hypothetical protein